MKNVIALLSLLVLTKLISAQEYSIVLGRPTTSQVTASVMFEEPAEFYLEYGNAPGVYNQTSAFESCAAFAPVEMDLVGLVPNTKYYYIMHYRAQGVLAYTNSPEYSFQTQRAPGSEFVFTLEADEHLYDKKGVKSIYQICLNNQAADKPDFMMSLGDIFGDDHHPDSITSADLDLLHRDYRPFLGSICHSIPFYVCLGNHEGENDYYMQQTPPNNLAINGTLWRKYYYPNPYPNDFYSGNNQVEPYGVELPENYYAWTWGDALFVVMDVYRDQCDTSAKPQNWNWSLGEPQYNWLKNTLEGSTATHKMVFAHHVRGQGRGAAIMAPYFEWGGHQNNGTYTFDQYRPGWAKPIHQLFIDTGVDIFFQGHDHLFAHEVLDNVVYQEVPMPSDSTYQIGMLANADAYLSDTLDGSGHLRITVNPGCLTVDFVRAYLPADTLSGEHHNGEVAFSYTLGECTTEVSTIVEQTDLLVYPNPAKERLAINIQNPEKYHLQLTDALGRQVFSGKCAEVDVRDYTDGVYVLTLSSSSQTLTRKIIIQH